MEFNEYQTPITEELLASLPKEVQEQLLDAVNNIEFVKRLVSPNRPKAKDLPRDEYGRIIVDVTNPHILEDMDYFRPAALYYKKHGVYTHLKPNPNPNSEFQKWFREEINRCWNGYVRESDGGLQAICTTSLITLLLWLHKSGRVRRVKRQIE